MATPKAPAGHFALLYFAAATSYTQRQHEFIHAQLLVNQLFGLLEKQYPGITQKVLESCAVTVNVEYIDMEEEAEKAAKGGEGLVIREGDEVGIIPPVSSG